MRILFVCGSLEPGHDGVGDYTRELAAALSRLHSVETRIISIKDRSETGVSEEVQISRNQNVEVKRLGTKLSFRKRRKAYKSYVHSFKPNWISLQYVPYAFSAKGLPIDLVRFLKIKDTDIKWHFMIHEAFVWQNLNSKLKILKLLQIRILKNLFKRLSPQRVHTSNAFYQKLLDDISIGSARLGLFGNIEMLENHLIIKKAAIRQGVFFGSGPIRNNFPAFADGIKSLFSNSKEPLNIVFCGRPDFRTIDFANYLRLELSAFDVNIEEKGALENEELSFLLLHSHFGISREPPGLMGKSGTVAVMLEHGLPLWVPLAENKSSFIDEFDFRIDQCFIDLHEMLRANFSHQYNPKSRIEDISNQFYSSLKSS